MTVSDLIEIYQRDPKSSRLLGALGNDEAKVVIKGAVGSSIGLISSGIMEQMGGNHLFILNEKEQAAYFLNDIQNITGNQETVLFFPRSARVPYQTESTQNANIAMRAEVLNKISTRNQGVVIVTFAEALAENVVTQKQLTSSTFELKVGQEYSMDFIDEYMIECDFEKVDYVYEPGQYSVRGGIVDVFSFGNDHPYRIEFFGDEVESIRKFDPVSQLSINKMTKAVVVPAVGEKMMQKDRSTFLEFLPLNTTVWAFDVKACESRIEKEIVKAQTHFDKLESPLNHLPPESLYSTPEGFIRMLQNFSLVEFGGSSYFPESEHISYDMTPQPSFNKNFELLGKNLINNAASDYKTVITSNQPKQIERIYNIFEDRQETVPFSPITIALNEGFVDKSQKLLCYTDHQIFERYHRFRLKEGFKRNKEAITLKEINNLEPGDYVVHIDHGIGEFSGLQKIDVNGKEQEAIRLTYKGGDILYVSIHSLHRISKYSGKDGTQPKINKLGTNAWQTVKNKTKSRVKEIAYDLLKLYAKRKASKGHAFAPDSYLQTELEASFMFEDTPDQITATQSVKEDMEQDAPMDRLVCGDVGFGKTEIAIRAAFKAVAESKQVAVLVPTTILSLQHYKSFKKRLKDFPCNVDYLNRFKTGKKLTETFKKIESGEVDIVIGTHKLVSSRTKFKDLGLLIIDEEQKFGVAVKDKLKTMKADVDTLTLTATPIPRTLQFSLMGARDLSIINTPPPNRHPVETEIRPFNEEVIRDAISYEISRGGQVYFVHNRVANIKEVGGMIQRLVPDARICIGHGQMEGEKLERIMTDFIDGVYDVLIATTIIESGIDISNANTMIINQAQNFGLSDLHQLRGRVGRSNRKAFCYLLAPPLSALSQESRKRLQAIEQFSDLGSGLNIAMRDLDIRGAGNLLGGEQSGFITDIGFDMYQKILAEAIQELKEADFKEMVDEEQIKSQVFVTDTVLETDFEILIQDDYVSSIVERIQLYKSLDECTNEAELEKFRTEMTDRFGPIPKHTEDLLETIKLRWIAKDIGFEKVILKSGKMIGAFVSRQDSPYYQSTKFTRVLDFIKHHPKRGKMYEKNGTLRMSFPEVNSISEAIKVCQLMIGKEVNKTV